MAAQGYRQAEKAETALAPANEAPRRSAAAGEASASDAELTSEQFVRGVALALRAQWEGEDRFGTAAAGLSPDCPDDEAADQWSDYRAESEAAILAYLEMLRNWGFSIVRKAN